MSTIMSTIAFAEGSGVVRRKKKANATKVNGKEKEGVIRGAISLGVYEACWMMSASFCGIITAIAFGAINIHDLELCRDLLMTTPMLKPGDTLLVDNAFIDGKTISLLKKKRRVDVIIPLRSDMLAYEACAVR
jgi:hypothetical protein